MTQPLPFRYLAISDRSVCPEPIPRRINRLVQLGVPAIQLRDKNLSDRRRFEYLRQIQTGGSTLLVNGRWDLAVLGEADGVHQPSDGLPIDVMKKLGDHDFLYGSSTHSREEIRRAEAGGADYVTFGPVFPTPSKPNRESDDIPGLETLEEVSDETDLPVLALGGVTPDRLNACLDAGAYGAAGIRALFEPDDPEANWNQLQTRLETVTEGHENES